MRHIYILLIVVFNLSVSQVLAQDPSDCACFEMYAPVCGSNGISYSNYCYAECDGIVDYSEGECQELTPILTASVGELFTYSENLGPDTSPVDGPMLFLCSFPDWASANIVSSPMNGNSFGDWLLEIEGTPSINDMGENHFVVCSSSAWSGDIAVMDTLTVSVILNCICPTVEAPVCGVDGNTYSNSCEAACANVEVAYSGVCTESTNCIGDVEILSQEVINGFAGPMLHLQVMNVGEDLEGISANVNLGICPSTDYFVVDFWAAGEIVDMYYNFACLSMAPYIEPYEAQLIISGNANCADSFSFEFDPQGGITAEGCTDADGTFYANGEEWNQDDCTFCSCENGEILCMVVDCAMPPCDNPIYIEGQCCPVCEVEGCIDPQATNFSFDATIDDGSCEYYFNEDYCNYLGSEVSVGDVVYYNGEYCTCELNSMLPEWGFVPFAEMSCAPEGCTSAEGIFYAVGESMEGECETCVCSPSVTAVYPPEPPSWTCYEIADCGDCTEVICPPGMFCQNGECIPDETDMQCVADNGEAFPIGYVMEGECETCICTESFLDVYPPAPPTWQCYEIADCGMVYGCTNPDAFNYNPEATFDDGSCVIPGSCVGADGLSYAIGDVYLANCETCECVETLSIPGMPALGAWQCETIVGCEEDPCNLLDCAFGCENGECLPDPNEIGCTSNNGIFYPVGAMMEGECEICVCEDQGIIPNNPYWICEEIPNCGEPQNCEMVYMNMSVGNDYYQSWYPGMTYSIIDENGMVIASGTNDAASSTDTLCLPAACNYQVVMDEVSPYGGCELAVWTLLNDSGEVLASNITCDEYWANNSMTYSVGFDIGCVSDCVCPEIYAPVCGSDGVTYGNSCEAECMGITEYYEGDCLPTSFCEDIEVVAETMYDDNGQVQLHVTVTNNSVNNISYPVFNLETDLLTVETLFENAYWIGAGESTTNSYLVLGGGNMAMLVEATYYVSQLNQNAACAYPISFTYEPIWGSQYCYSNGAAYEIGEVLTGPDWCESCVCEASDALAINEPGVWACEPIIGCGEEVYGCTDPNAENYDPLATICDESCMYVDYCDALTITSTNVNADGVLEVFLTNNSTNIFSYPQLNVIDEDGQVLAEEETFYYGIGTESMHSLEILVPMSEWSVNTMLQVNTNFGEEFACQMPIEFEDPCNLVDCAPGYDCVNGDCVQVEPQEYGCTDAVGNFYAFGETMMQDCNTCTCTPGFNPNAEGFWMCTMMACEEECLEGENSYELVMNFNGMDAGSFTVNVGDQTYSVAQPENGLMTTLNFCAAPEECIEIYALQTTMGPPFTHSLYADGVLVAENESQYNCGASEDVYGCTDPDAINHNPMATLDDGSCEYAVGTCEFEGELYEFGATVEQGCNTCYCEAGINPSANGFWSCTEMACSGCTDPAALNYDEYADWDDDSCEYSTCTGYDAILTVNMEAFGAEHWWKLLNSSGEVLYYEYINPSYSSNETMLCLEGNTSYTMSIFDAYGDGWNGGSFSITSSDCELVSGGLETGQNAQFEFVTACEESSAPDWTYENTGTNHTIVIPEDVLVDINGMSIESGDWIGVFYQANGQVNPAGYVVWETSTTMIAAQGDDLTTVETDGFVSGDEFVWMVWDASENEVWTMEANYNMSSPNQELFEVNGISSLMSLTVLPQVAEQELALSTGWNMFSTYMQSDVPYVSDLFISFIEDVVIIKNNEGAAYLPEYNYDGIGLMLDGQAYQAKLLNPLNIVVTGQYINPEDRPIQLSEGWNMIAYYPLTGMNAELIFENVSDVVIVKDNTGMAYLPDYNFNGIGSMIPGQGYQVKVLSNQTLQYPANE